jgi:predicted ferric reductase
MDEKVWWYLARAGGITAWALVAAATLWGLVLSTRIAKGKVTPAWLLDLHRHLGALGLVFSGVHVLGLVADSWVHFGWVEVLVPFAAEHRPAATAAGVLALHLLVAVEVTSLLQRRLPRRVWRRVHGLSLPLFLLSTVHTLAAGTDGEHPVLAGATALVAIAFMVLMTYRAVLALAPGRPA